MLPPGSEELALDVLTYIFSKRQISFAWHFLTSSLNQPAGSLQLPDETAASKTLLQAFAMAYLGLRPETAAKGKHSKQSASSTGARGQSLRRAGAILAPEESLLPLEPTWLYNWVRPPQRGSIAFHLPLITSPCLGQQSSQSVSTCYRQASTY